MCTYTAKIDDTVMPQARGHFVDEKRRLARRAIEAMRRQSEQNGNSELTLDDINTEIRQARAERKTIVL